MRFTRLRLNGFKSFVDPTDLVIADGLTGVVGPNGCGKSNLLEALRWVMGENRPTAMRGDGMEDVIFAGSGTRPARHFAEVALQIDNADRLAPAGFNDTDLLDITRRITREAGSAYKVQGREVRARDVQMLFADASTGSHSPALVRQGQIAELINARPVARRRVLEEAAGISGLYQRRHEAELKLRGAEANLLRLDDVIEGLASQMAALARQARVALRYREIGQALRRAEGLLLFRRWHEAEAAQLLAEADLRACLIAAGQAESQALAAGRARADADMALPPLREEEAIAGAVLQRLTVQAEALEKDEARAAEAIAQLVARIAQLDRDAAREGDLRRDADQTMARLADEHLRLTEAGVGHAERLSASDTAARDAATALQGSEADQARLTEDVARLAARHQSAERLIADTRTRLTRAEGEAARALAAQTEASAAVARAEADLTGAGTAVTRAAGLADTAERALAEAEAARGDTQTRESAARSLRAGAEGEAAAITAEVNALTRLVARDTKDGGQLLDLLAVDDGYEKALGAALADDLRAPLQGVAGGSGWADLAAYDPAPPLPAGVRPLAAGVRPLADVVRAPPLLTRRLSQLGLVAASDGARLQPLLGPGQRIVSVEGDLWRWDGFTATAADAPSAAALRLQQLNRLVALKRDLEDVSARAMGARLAHDVLTARMAQITDAETRARAARREADRQLTEAHRALSRAEADRDLAQGKRESAALALARHQDEAREAQGALDVTVAGRAALGDLAQERIAADFARQKAELTRATLMQARSQHDDLRRQGERRADRLSSITREKATWADRLATADTRAAELTARHAGAEADLKTARLQPAEIAGRRAALADGMATAQTRRACATDALSTAEAALATATATERDTERAASAAREDRARAEARRDAGAEALATASQRIREAVDLTPPDLLVQLDTDPATILPADALETETNALRRQRDALGAVNLRAEDDAVTVTTEHDRLVSEKADLEGAIKALRTGIASLNREGRERLLTAFEQVNANFALLFTHLFGGGEARLVLVESDDPLEAGLEIMCQPPGKKLSTLSLLSGGEQTLTALALIFGVFLANPAPICVLDEVDAPLDDANVTRFCDLLDEMTRRTETRFLIITHHSVTMSRMDRLYGVTMGEPGVSQLVSVDLRKAAALVA